jgi:ribosomal protein L37E
MAHFLPREKPGFPFQSFGRAKRISTAIPCAAQGEQQFREAKSRPASCAFWLSEAFAKKLEFRPFTFLKDSQRIFRCRKKTLAFRSNSPGAVKEVPDSAGGRRPASDRLRREGQNLKTKNSRGNSNGTPRPLYRVYENTTQQKL